MVKHKIVVALLSLSLGVVFLCASAAGTALTEREEAGKKLFRKCAVCHRTDDKPKKGPGLKGATQRMPGGDWRYRFVRNAQEVIASGDAYATRLYVEYKRENMTAFPKLTNDQIDQIFEYIDAVNR
ncbi:MAG: cytochrome c [Bacteroidetes bacterium]|nr:cytochrome c [Bacteroidota bacterium]